MKKNVHRVNLCVHLARNGRNRKCTASFHYEADETSAFRKKVDRIECSILFYSLINSSHFLGGKTIRRCIRYTDCDNSRLSQKFPSISEYTYRCCNTDLCNSGPATAASTWILSLLAVLTSLWSCMISH